SVRLLQERSRDSTSGAPAIAGRASTGLVRQVERRARAPCDRPPRFTSFWLRSCRRSSTCFLVLNNRGWLAQHDFAHEHPVTNCRIIDCCRHIWPNGRPTDGATFRI